MRSWVSRSEGETLTIGSELAGTLAPDGVLLLWGGLGSGKTVLAQGLARGLGFERRRIQSPTYTLMHEYERPGARFVHADLYRLEPEQVASLGFEVVAVMRPLDNVHLNRFLVASRRRNGLRLLDKKGATAGAEDLLRDGALLGFIGDQDAGRKGVFVDFFGRPASTYKSIGLLAISTGVPIVVGYARRCDHRGQYEVGVQEIIHPEQWEQRDDPVHWITQAYTAAIEATVREDPDQYLWIHRRWKTQPRIKSV